jgi:hypothetical protein
MQRVTESNFYVLKKRCPGVLGIGAINVNAVTCPVPTLRPFHYPISSPLLARIETLEIAFLEAVPSKRGRRAGEWGGVEKATSRFCVHKTKSLWAPQIKRVCARVAQLVCTGPADAPLPVSCGLTS